MTAHGRIAALGLALATAASPLPGQSPPDRSALHYFRDSLAAISDSTALLAEERRGMAAARADRNDAMLHLRLGFVALRLGKLTGETGHYGDAKTEFDWARDLEGGWPYAWFGAGLASLEQVAAEPQFVVNLIALFGTNPFSEAHDDLVHSAQLEPAFPEGLVEVADVALRGGEESSLRAVLAVLRGAAATPAGETASAMLARIDVENDIGDPDSALALADLLLHRDPDNAAALLARARTTWFMGRTTGAADWYRGLALGDSAVWRRYRADLAVLLPDTMLVSLDQAAPAERVARMRRFWAERDMLGAGADRLAAHYQRLEYALDHYAESLAR